MGRTTVTLTVIWLGIGCSHATPKSEFPAAAFAPPPRSAPAPAPRQEISENTSSAEHRDATAGNVVYFDFDSSLIRDDSRLTLQQVGSALTHSSKTIRIEGNCDERGTTEYNLVLGERRAREAKRYLENLGVPRGRIAIVSYGSERPKAPGHDETAWAQNRRDDLKVR